MENPNVLNLPDWVKAARKSKGWTLEQLGKQMGRTKATVGFWEKGTTSPSVDQIVHIAHLTGHPIPFSSVRIHQYSSQEIGKVVMELGSILLHLTEMERAGIAPIINKLLQDPSIGPEAAEMAMRITQRPGGPASEK